MPVTRDGQYHPETTLAFWRDRGVWLVAWIRTDAGWWAHIRWVEPFIVDGVSQGGINIDVCVPAGQMRRNSQVPQREYDLLKRVDARAGRADRCERGNSSSRHAPQGEARRPR